LILPSKLLQHFFVASGSPFQRLTLIYLKENKNYAIRMLHNYPNRSKLLNFLSEPRCLKEITDRFGISASTADYCLQKAIKQNQVIICKYSKKASLKSRKKQKQRETLFYISRDSGLHSKGLTGFVVARVAGAQKAVSSKTTFVEFSSRSASKSSFSSIIENTSDSKNRGPKQTTLPKVKASREQLVRNAQRHVPVVRQPLKQSQIKLLSVAEKLSMLMALSRQPLPHSDLHARFNISKRTLKTFVKNGLIEEIWGPQNIGVKFRLTTKGEKYLERLEASAKLGMDKIRKATIHLKYRNL
jgi:DNA-binding MarR family transcriptional regulator